MGIATERIQKIMIIEILDSLDAKLRKVFSKRKNVNYSI